MRWMVLTYLLLLLGCGSTRGWRMPDSDDSASSAPGEAYAADSMTFRKDMPHQADPVPWQFYYKHCSMNGDESFYSKTSYDCTGPAF